ncbi:MAG: lipoprotein [Blautia coccoides]
MKKILSMFLTTIMIFTLSACGGDVVAIEDYEWKMRTVASNDIEAAQAPDELIVAVGKADALYPEAEIVDLTLNAKDGAITITDRTNNKTYSGTYEVQQKTPKGTDYEIIINGVSGYATVSPTEYYDGSEIPTLPININGYSLYFIPEKA